MEENEILVSRYRKILLFPNENERVWKNGEETFSAIGQERDIKLFKTEEEAILWIQAQGKNPVFNYERD